MSDQEIAVTEPDVGFDAYAPGLKRIVQGYLAFIVVVRMAGYGDDASTEIGRIVRQAIRRRARFPPCRYQTLDVVAGDLGSEMDVEVYQERKQSPSETSMS